MAFTAHSSLLKLDFIVTTVLFFLGLVTLSSMALYAKPGSDSACLLYWSEAKHHPDICKFSIVSGVIISLMALGLFGLDYVTWKRSENYKGKRASLTALILAPVMGLFSFCSAIVFSLGIKTTCDNYGGCNDRHTIAGIKGIYTGISCAALAGLFFVVYASSEYIQYRRRHVEGDKW